MIRRVRWCCASWSSPYAQCYPTATFALALTIGTSLALIAERRVHIAGLAMIALAFVYFLAVETRWFAAQLSAFSSPDRLRADRP